MPVLPSADENGMIPIAGPYLKTDPDEITMFQNVVRDLERPDRRGDRIRFAIKTSRRGHEVWRVPSPDMIDTHSFASRYRK